MELKHGAQVMLLKNDPEKRWVNGTLGRVRALNEKKVSVDIAGTSCDVEPETWKNIQYRFDRDTNRIEEEVIGTFTQYPLRLAWAITIHKSQGQTFDKVLIDLGAGLRSRADLRGAEPLHLTRRHYLQPPCHSTGHPL